MKKLLLLLSFAPLFAFAAERSFTITSRYLNFPVSQKVDRQRMTFTLDGERQCSSVVRLTAEPEYWVFQDVSLWKGRTLTLSGDFSSEALDAIVQADTIMGQSEIYHEALRPQYHFTTRRGWINDPNGLIFHNGRYHMFYQHNPYEREWENMHWGHTVSSDLLHWQEQPLALHPDEIGTMFSGTAVIDHLNSAGFNAPDGTPAMLAFYTADGKWQTQCMAYSLDEGLTWTKYEGNPIIDSHERWQSHDTRDPKVFYYAPGNHWVLVLNERDGNTIYNSTDLKHWTPVSHITGFWECPELFELPVEGRPEERHWVMWGASGTYMIGRFDGRTFTPETPKQMNLNGSAYAAQTFANIPEEDGRVIKMAWSRTSFDQMPFNGAMLLPQEQTLVRTKQGLRLFSRPIAECEQLFTLDSFTAGTVSADEANRLMEQYAADDILRIRCTLRLTYATDAGLSFRGQRLVSYDLNGNRLQGEFYAKAEPTSLDLDCDIYLDRSLLEVFIDGGAFSYSSRLDGRQPEGYRFWGNQLQVRNLAVYKAKSIW